VFVPPPAFSPTRLTPRPCSPHRPAFPATPSSSLPSLAAAPPALLEAPPRNPIALLAGPWLSPRASLGLNRRHASSGARRAYRPPWSPPSRSPQGVLCSLLPAAPSPRGARASRPCLRWAPTPLTSRRLPPVHAPKPSLALPCPACGHLPSVLSPGAPGFAAGLPRALCWPPVLPPSGKCFPWALVTGVPLLVNSVAATTPVPGTAPRSGTQQGGKGGALPFSQRQRPSPPRPSSPARDEGRARVERSAGPGWRGAV